MVDAHRNINSPERRKVPVRAGVTLVHAWLCLGCNSIQAQEMLLAKSSLMPPSILTSERRHSDLNNFPGPLIPPDERQHSLTCGGPCGRLTAFTPLMH